MFKKLSENWYFIQDSDKTQKIQQNLNPLI